MLRRQWPNSAAHLLWVLLLVVLSQRAVFAGPPRVGWVRAARGDLHVRRAGTVTPLTQFADLYAGDVVSTGPTGTAELQFNDGKQVRIHGSSSLRIEHSKGQSWFQIIIGVIWAAVRPGSKQEYIDVTTPAASIIVEGTEFVVEVKANGATTVTVLEGNVRFANAFGQSEVGQKQRSTAEVGQAPSPPVTVDVTGLTEWTADVASLPLEFEMPAAAQIPAALQAPLTVALSYLSQGQVAKARDALKPVSDQPIAQAVLAMADLHEGHAADAQEKLHDAVTREPDLPAAWALLALAHLTQNHLADAEKAAREAVRQVPTSAPAQGTLAMVLFFTHRPEEARKAADRAVAVNPHSAFAQLTRGRILMSKLQTDAAGAAFAQAVALAPDLWVAHTELGGVYLRLDMLPRAEKEYRRASELAPDAAEVHVGLGRVHQQKGQDADAETEYLTALKLDPTNVTARGFLAALYIRQGRFDVARKELEQGILNRPDRGSLFVDAAELSLYQQDLFAAQEFARRAVELLPASAPAHYQLGRVYLEQGRIVQAEQEFRQAVTLDRQFAAAQYALGFTQEKTDIPFVTSLSSLANPVIVGSPGSSLTLENLETPGAEQRIQAALQDPTVIRVASRSYGNTELYGAAGERNIGNYALSALQTSRDARGVGGITAERQQDGGVRTNADKKFDTASVEFGQKASGGPSSFFILGQAEQLDSGVDIGVTSDSFAATQRFQSKLSRLLTGFNVQPQERSRTRALLQVSNAKFGNRDFADPNNRNDFHISGVNAELRYDVQVGERHSFIAGATAGTRRRSITTPIALDSDSPPASVVGAFDVVMNKAYVRDEIKTSERLSFTGEMQIQQLRVSQSTRSTTEQIPSSPNVSRTTTVAIPLFIAAFRLEPRSNLRFRARRLFATIEDFELLVPRDVFLTSVAGLPQATLIDPTADGRSLELEYDLTFRDASFLRVSLLHQNIHNADIPGVGVAPIANARVRKFRASYEGLIGRDLSFFVNADLNRATNKDDKSFVEQLPHFIGVSTLQYLSSRGVFAHIIFYHQGGQIFSSQDNTREAGFNVVNLRLGKRSGLRSSVFMEINNMLNTNYAVYGNLQEGRQFRMGTSIRF